MPAAKKKTPARRKAKKWSGRVTATSNAMDIAPDTFTSKDPKKIARTVERDAEKSKRRKASPYRSAMSMLTFYINRAGKNLPAKQRKVLEDAKDVLRESSAPKRKPPQRSGDGFLDLRDLLHDFFQRVVLTQQ